MSDRIRHHSAPEQGNAPNARSNATSYSLLLDFVPGRGFVVTLMQPHHSITCPDEFVSLAHAARFAERELVRAGVAVALAE